jgi:RNA polymerase sigma factor (sigma-70 family)
MRHHTRSCLDQLEVDRLRRLLNEMVAAAAEGDQAAWSDLVARFRGRVIRVARAHGLDPYQADDVAQETWLRLYRNLANVRDPFSLGAWIETTARRESLRALVGRRREELTGDDVGVDRPVLDDGDDADFEERKAALARGLKKLNGRQRALMDSLLAEPAPSYADVSLRVGIPIGSIGPTRGRCVKRLRQELAPELV